MKMPRFIRFHEHWRIDLAGVLGLLLVTALALGVAFLPLFWRWESQVRLREQLEERRARAGEQDQSIEMMTARVAELRAAAQVGPVVLRASTSVNQRLAELTQLAAEADLAIEEMKPGDAWPEGSLTVAPIRLAGTGTYQAATRFMRMLRDRFPDMAVDGFDMHRRPGPASSSAVRVDVRWFRLTTDEPNPRAVGMETAEAATASSSAVSSVSPDAEEPLR